MIKKLLGSLAIILLFSGCVGDGTDGLPKVIAPPNYARVFLSKTCDEPIQNNEFYIDVDCEVFEQLDYINNPPEKCEEVTVTSVEGIIYTELFTRARSCDGTEIN